jgi:hypothetical protein
LRPKIVVVKIRLKTSWVKALNLFSLPANKKGQPSLWR